jgi:hypothetical protein
MDVESSIVEGIMIYLYMYMSTSINCVTFLVLVEGLPIKLRLQHGSPDQWSLHWNLQGGWGVM